MRHFIAASLLLLAACSNGGPTAPLDREFRLAIGETAHIQGTGLKLTFRRVSEDSRCPSDVVCAQAGNAKIEIEATLNGSPTSVTLNTPSAPTEAFVGGFRVKLAGLLPVPLSTEPVRDRDYRARLLIEEAGGCPIEMLCAQ